MARRISRHLPADPIPHRAEGRCGLNVLDRLEDRTSALLLLPRHGVTVELGGQAGQRAADAPLELDATDDVPRQNVGQILNRHPLGEYFELTTPRDSL